jgi:hypothetical protein
MCFPGLKNDEFGCRLGKKKKVVRSRDLVFEYQTIEDFEQKEKIVSANFISANADQRPFHSDP